VVAPLPEFAQRLPTSRRTTSAAAAASANRRARHRQFDFVINMKQAGTLGLTVNHELLVQATDLIR